MKGLGPLNLIESILIWGQLAGYLGQCSIDEASQKMDRVPIDLIKYHLLPFLGLRDEAYLDESGVVGTTGAVSTAEKGGFDFKKLWPLIEGKSDLSRSEVKESISSKIVWKMIHDRKEYFPKLQGPGSPLVRCMIHSPGFFDSVPSEKRPEFANWLFMDDDRQWSPVMSVIGPGRAKIHSEISDGLLLPEWVVKQSMPNLTNRFWVHRKCATFTGTVRPPDPGWSHMLHCSLLTLAVVEVCLIVRPMVFVILTDCIQQYTNIYPDLLMPHFAMIALKFVNPETPENVQERAVGLVNLMYRHKWFDLLHWKAKAHILDQLIRPEVLAICEPEQRSWLGAWINEWSPNLLEGQPELKAAHSRSLAHILGAAVSIDH